MPANPSSTGACDDELLTKILSAAGMISSALTHYYGQTRGAHCPGDEYNSAWLNDMISADLECPSNLADHDFLMTLLRHAVLTQVRRIVQAAHMIRRGRAKEGLQVLTGELVCFEDFHSVEREALLVMVELVRRLVCASEPSAPCPLAHQVAARVELECHANQLPDYRWAELLLPSLVVTMLATP